MLGSRKNPHKNDNSPQQINFIFLVSLIFWIEYQARILDIKSQAPPYAPCVIWARHSYNWDKGLVASREQEDNPLNMAWLKMSNELNTGGRIFTPWRCHLCSCCSSWTKEFSMLSMVWFRTGVIWKSGPGWWWITNRLGWLLEPQTELFNNNK